jgi:hypothetical protein
VRLHAARTRLQPPRLSPRLLREIRRRHSGWCLAQAPALPLSIGPTYECMPTGTSPFQAAAGRALETHLVWERRRTNELLEQLPRESHKHYSCCNGISRPPRTATGGTNGQCRAAAGGRARSGKPGWGDFAPVPDHCFTRLHAPTPYGRLG